MHLTARHAIPIAIGIAQSSLCFFARKALLFPADIADFSILTLKNNLPNLLNLRETKKTQRKNLCAFVTLLL
ncbi:hypothetical protein D0809_15090 [Flavobacterium circumlabens]|uniref:Uncharacterized protein n=1 Tax=Flavobacterium circumlabens TaxID=2133765 RepID=A0A4Y7UAM5_9FLAO|nr:hypothetical protein D0809_15090 [Flavobacterium circumlabens]